MNGESEENCTIMHSVRTVQFAAGSGTTQELAILSLGHFLHYGREAMIRQMVELYDEHATSSSNEEEPAV